MPYVSNVFTVEGLPRNGATVNLYYRSAFVNPPSGGSTVDGGTVPPATGILQTTTTGLQHGGNGAYRFSVAGSGEWYAGISWNGYYAWDYYTVGGVPALTVADYGAVGDGIADDTAAFNSAIAAAASGGVVLLPDGHKFAVNLVITTPNVLLRGGSMQLSTPVGSKLVPANTAKPVVQVGNDTGLVQGVRLENVSIHSDGPTGTGTVGLFIGGGAIRGQYRNVAIHGFTQNSLILSGGTTYQNEYNWIDGLYIDGSNACTDAVIRIQYGGNFTAANWITNSNINGQLSGHTIIIDNVQMFMANTWIQVARSTCGIRFLNDNGSGPAPFLRCSNVVIDSNATTDTLVETYQSNLIPARELHGVVSVDGQMEDSSGNKAPLTSYGAVMSPANAVHNTPWVYGAASFVPAGIYSNNKAHTVYASGSTGNGLTNQSLFLASSGCIYFVTNTNQSVQFCANLGSPEGVVSAATGDCYYQQDADPGRLWWAKTNGKGNTGWRPITEHVPYRSYSNSSSSGNVSVAIDDQIVGINGSAVTKVQLPAAPQQGRVITVKDVGGNAASFNIIVYANAAGKTLDGAGWQIISSNYGVVRLISDGTNWFTL